MHTLCCWTFAQEFRPQGYPTALPGLGRKCLKSLCLVMGLMDKEEVVAVSRQKSRVRVGAGPGTKAGLLAWAGAKPGTKAGLLRLC